VCVCVCVYVCVVCTESEGGKTYNSHHPSFCNLYRPGTYIHEQRKENRLASEASQRFARGEGEDSLEAKAKIRIGYSQN